MTTLTVPFALLAALCSTIYLAGFCASPPSLAKSAMKTAATLFLAAAALFSGSTPWLVAALGFGALGDLLLSRNGQRPFLTGLVAFAIAHLAYVGLFVFAAGADFSELGRGAHAAGLFLLMAFGSGMSILLWPKAGEMRWPVMAYIVVILFMGVSALALPGGIGPVPLIAALFFIASDTILAGELFLLPDDHPFRRITPYAVWTLYWSAQALFLLVFLPVSGS